MKTDVNVKVRIIRKNTKYHGNLFKNVLNALMSSSQNDQTFFQNLPTNCY